LWVLIDKIVVHGENVLQNNRFCLNLNKRYTVWYNTYIHISEKYQSHLVAMFRSPFFYSPSLFGTVCK